MQGEQKQDKQLYYEKQGVLSNECGKYALNHLLGNRLIHSQHLKQIAAELERAYDGSYSHMLGGDYDSSVLVKALALYDYETVWMDNRLSQTVRQKGLTQNPNRLGFLLNRAHPTNPLKKLFGFSDRHWVSVRQVKGQGYFLFDSKSDAQVPEHIGLLGQFLSNEMANGSHVIEVVKNCRKQ